MKIFKIFLTLSLLTRLDTNAMELAIPQDSTATQNASPLILLNQDIWMHILRSIYKGNEDVVSVKRILQTLSVSCKHFKKKFDESPKFCGTLKKFLKIETIETDLYKFKTSFLDNKAASKPESSSTIKYLKWIGSLHDEIFTTIFSSGKYNFDRLLKYMIRCGNVTIVRIIIEEAMIGKIQLDFNPPDMIAPIMEALTSKNVEMIQLLANTQAIDLNLLVKDVYTPLSMAMIMGNFEIIKILLGKPNVDIFHSSVINHLRFFRTGSFLNEALILLEEHCKKFNKKRGFFKAEYSVKVSL